MLDRWAANSRRHPRKKPAQDVYSIPAFTERLIDTLVGEAYLPSTPVVTVNPPWPGHAFLHCTCLLLPKADITTALQNERSDRLFFRRD